MASELYAAPDAQKQSETGHQACGCMAANLARATGNSCVRPKLPNCEKSAASLLNGGCAHSWKGRLLGPGGPVLALLALAQAFSRKMCGDDAAGAAEVEQKNL